MVVECYTHADIMERRCIALQVFYSIGIGMENIFAIQYLLRCERSPLYQVVVVGIYTSNHVASHLVANEAHQCSLLATLQMIRACRQHHFEI